MKNCVKFKCKTLCFNNFFKYAKLFVLLLISIIGVGFISGAEIYQFFVKFENLFWFGILLFFVLMFALTNKILSETTVIKNSLKMQNLNISTSKNTLLAKIKIKSFLTNFCYILMSAAMLSGLRNLIKQLFFNNFVWLFVFAIFLVFVLLYFGVSGLAKFDIFVLICVIFFSVFAITKIDFAYICSNAKFSGLNFVLCLIMSVCYVFMNIIQIKPVAEELELDLTKKQRLWFSGLFSFSLSALLVIFCLFLKTHGEYSFENMPFLSYFLNQGLFLKIFFSSLLFLALISSLMSALIGFKSFIGCKVKGNFNATLVTLVLSLLVSVFDFEFFVSIVYPLVGIINFVIFVFL